MSRRFTQRVTCPDCGLEVQANGAGKIKAHSTKALEAGKLDSPCVDGNRRAQETIASNNRREAASTRRAYWDEKAAKPTTLPPHLR